MGLYVDLQAQHYLDTTYGVVSNVAGDHSCDNYHLFTAETMEVAGWDFWPQYVSFYKGCEIWPGLIKRYPQRENGGISQDEMIGAATLDQIAAQRIFDYGKSNEWVFNPDMVPLNIKNIWSYWFGRFIDFAPYIKFRATGKMNLWDQIKWTIPTLLNPLTAKGNTSGKCLKWVQIKKVWGHYYLTDLAIVFWKWRMRKLYPNGMKDVFKIYFGENHPITKYARDDFE